MTTSRAARLLPAIAFLVAVRPEAAGDTLVGGTISTDTTWTTSGSPYVITSDLLVTGGSAPTLTIKPGVVVKSRAGKAFSIGNPGRLVAIGSGGQPILFTTDQGTVTAGYWRGLFLGSATLPSTLSYVTVEGGGYNAYGIHSGIQVGAGSPTFDNITLRTNNYAGFTVSGGSPSLTNSTISGTTGGDGVGIDMISPGSLSISNVSITGNAGGAMTLRNGAAYTSVSGLTATGNGTNAVLYRSQVATTNQTWRSFGLPYVLDSYINVAGASGPILTIEPGTTIKMRNGNDFTIGYLNPGKLVAVGTSTQPIVFTTFTTPVTAGAWRGLGLDSATLPSTLSYVTVEGGGYNAYGIHSGIQVGAGSPTFDNITLRTNNYAGFTVSGGSPSLTNSTISGTTGGDGVGIDMISPGSLSISNVSITGNAGGAMTLRNGAAYTSVSGLTATGNGTNAVLYRSQVATTNQTWRSFGLPYVLDSYINVAGASGPILTIEPGTTIKMRNGNDFTIGYLNPGKLVAVGTSTQPIVFTTFTTPVTAGAWRGLGLDSATLPSTLSYVTVEGGGYNAYGWSTGVGVGDGTHLLDHMTIRTNLGSGIKVGSGNPTIINCTISGNGTGILNATSPQRLIKAPLNYWGAADGPNAGSGTGSGDAISGLVRYDPFLVAPPVLPQYITAADLVERKFNPADGHRGTWTLGSTAPGNWTLSIKNSGNTLIRTMTTSGSPATLVWDGKNDGGADQPDGSYTYQLDNLAGVNAATSGKGRVFLDRTLACAIASPGASATVSNVYQNGSANVPVTGTAVSANFSNWTLDYGPGAAPTAWTILATGTSTVSNVLLGSWPTIALANGLYSVRLSLVDAFGNVISTSIGPTLGNFKVSANVLQFNAGASGSVVYTSTVPFNLTETVYIKTWAGAPVRTLVSALRTAGTYNDQYTASADPDGTYLYTAGVDDGAAHTMTWDQSTQFINGYSSYNDGLSFSTYDPFNNQPLTFTFNFAQPGAVSLAFTPVPTGPDNCNPPAFCILNRAVLESGSHTIVWAGVDGTGAFRPDIKSAGIVIDQTTFPVNGVVVYGRKPVVSAVRVTPPDFGPASGTQVVAFTLATYQSQSAAVTVSFLNQSSLSKLRTMSLPSQVPGNVNVTWDGRANDGSLVAPGQYTVTVTAVDSLGNSASGQILTRVEY